LKDWPLILPAFIKESLLIMLQKRKGKPLVQYLEVVQELHKEAQAIHEQLTGQYVVLTPSVTTEGVEVLFSGSNNLVDQINPPETREMIESYFSRAMDPEHLQPLGRVLLTHWGDPVFHNGSLFTKASNQSQVWRRKKEQLQKKCDELTTLFSSMPFIVYMAVQVYSESDLTTGTFRHVHEGYGSNGSMQELYKSPFWEDSILNNTDSLAMLPLPSPVVESLRELEGGKSFRRGKERPRGATVPKLRRILDLDPMEVDTCGAVEIGELDINQGPAIRAKNDYLGCIQQGMDTYSPIPVKSNAWAMPDYNRRDERSLSMKIELSFLQSTSSLL
jgi:hypothetical protein